MSDAANTSHPDDAAVRVERDDAIAVVTIDRPRALNALSFAMCRVLDDGLRRWQADPEVHAVLIKG
ncbi:MAG TPA: enoyl-CoA hydratase/isomerase family protein, partial [Agromyces sp.]|nr:enoyl-CoA hydratase/isomerase family protein [Agromyces sp.]